MITVIAQMRAKDGLEEKVKKELIALVVPTLTEAGCITYELHASPDQKDLFMFYEKWQSKEDLDGHLKKPYIKVFMDKAGDLLAEPVRVSLWENLA